MLNQRQRNAIKIRRARRVRATVRGTTERPRLAVFRSLKHISAQIIDDTKGRTVVAAHAREVEAKKKGMERAEAIGKLLGERAIAAGCKTVVFDRRSYRFHGQVKALAEAARAAGLIF